MKITIETSAEGVKIHTDGEGANDQGLVALALLSVGIQLVSKALSDAAKAHTGIALPTPEAVDAVKNGNGKITPWPVRTPR